MCVFFPIFFSPRDHSRGGYWEYLIVYRRLKMLFRNTGGSIFFEGAVSLGERDQVNVYDCVWETSLSQDERIRRVIVSSAIKRSSAVSRNDLRIEKNKRQVVIRVSSPWASVTSPPHYRTSFRDEILKSSFEMTGDSRRFFFLILPFIYLLLFFLFIYAYGD